jgi:putative ABC transport system permease protein
VALVELINFALSQGGGEGNMIHNPQVDFNVAINALIILVVSGAIAGFIPARKAISIKPIDALRYE